MGSSGPLPTDRRWTRSIKGRPIQAIEEQALREHQCKVDAYVHALREQGKAISMLAQAHKVLDDANDAVRIASEALGVARDDLIDASHRAGHHEGHAGHTLDNCERPSECGK